MCGIFLIYNRAGFLKEATNNYIKNAKLLKHRGDKDTYRIINNKLLLFHNRLSINDLSNNGTQPMIKNFIMIIANILNPIKNSMEPSLLFLKAIITV